MALEHPASLIKFCTTDSSLKILNSQSLRWSAVHLNNDPFELDHHSNPSLSADRLLNGMIKAAIVMLFGPNESMERSNKLVAAITRWRNEERFDSEQEAKAVLEHLFSQVAQQQINNADKLMAHWKQFAATTRVCSFSSKLDNMRCWQRYADNHSGVALKFNCGKGTSLPNPRQVSYSQIAPEITSLKQQVDISFGRQKAPEVEEFTEKLLIKSKLCSDENEWRCFSSDNVINDNEQLWHNTKTFYTNELQAVYFGINTPADQKLAILKLLKNSFKGTKVFQAIKQPGRFSIKFKAHGDH